MNSHLSRRTFIASAAATLVPAAIGHSQPAGNGLLSIFADEPATAGASTTPWKESGVIDLNRSPHAKLKTVPVSAVVIEDGFWSKRRRTNVGSSIPSMHDELLAHGRMDNFLRLEGKSSAPQKGPVYSDSDIYKWLEAVGFALQTDDPPEFKSTADGMIRDVVAAQEPSGYLNTYYQGEHKSLRMTYPTPRPPATSYMTSATCCREPSPTIAPPAIALFSTPAFALSTTSSFPITVPAKIKRALSPAIQKLRCR